MREGMLLYWVKRFFASNQKLIQSTTISIKAKEKQTSNSLLDEINT